MDKVRDITEMITLNKAVYILERLHMKYDYGYLKENPDICKSIVVLFEDNFEKI
ncbi:MAG: hypothetical protein RR844_09245 [Clostridium sp.]